jgi:hypothetical protein
LRNSLRHHLTGRRKEATLGKRSSTFGGRKKIGGKICFAARGEGDEYTNGCN